MNDRYSSVQVMVGGIVVGAIGAIVAYAITVRNHNVKVHTLGVILLVMGIAIFAVGIAAAIVGSVRGGDPPVDRY